MNEPRPLLEATDLSFGYRQGGRPVVDGFSHRFLAGSVTGVSGDSGRGKSTLLYLLGLLLTPNDGFVEVGGIRATGESDAVRSRLRADHIGFVFQDAALDPARTVLDNVVEGALFMRLSRRQALVEARRLLEELGVDLRADRRPGEISGGQAQRVALCRALLGGPAVVLADEPTGNLDAGNTELVVGALRRAAAGGATVIIASHDRFVLASCDCVVTPESHTETHK